LTNSPTKLSRRGACPRQRQRVVGLHDLLEPAPPGASVSMSAAKTSRISIATMMPLGMSRFGVAALLGGERHALDARKNQMP
jgi:hypothetical protein